MDFCKIIAIFSVFVITLIESKSVSFPSTSSVENPAENHTTFLRVPKNIKPGTNITILGNNNNLANFSATFSGDHMDKHDECNISFTPTQDRKQFIIKFNNQNETNNTTYDIDPENRGVFFTLHVIAYRVNDSDDIMDLYFEETVQGQVSIGTCRFTSLDSLEYIEFKGVDHVKNLSFNFSRPDIDNKTIETNQKPKYAF